MKRIKLPLDKETIFSLSAGDKISLTGYLYTARDAAHKRIADTLKRGENLPISFSRETIYYMGPTPTPPGKVIGACGPTTSHRLDPYMEILLKQGLLGTIGKGERSDEVIELLKRYKALYFVTFGGAGAYLSEMVKENTPVLYEDLGTEAVHRLYVENFPVILAIDVYGRTIFK